MAFILDKKEIQPGLIIFRRGDVQHNGWYCRMRLPGARYKTLSLETDDEDQAYLRARQQEGKAYWQAHYGSPLFNPPFSTVARRFLAIQRERAERGWISPSRLRKMEYVIARLLIPYIGTMPIQRAADEGRTSYVRWRRGETGEGRRRKIGLATIAVECGILNALLNYAVSKGYLASDLHFDGHPKYLRQYRSNFTNEQYAALVAVAKRRIADAQGEARWRRQMVYHFMQIIMYTGLRPGEAQHLRWRDISRTIDGTGTPILVFAVRWRDRARNAVAPSFLEENLAKISAISAATKPDDFVFTDMDGQRKDGLYARLTRQLLNAANLRVSPGNCTHAAYSFRHSYAMFQLVRGVSIYLLSLQMGTRVEFLEEYYGHARLINHAGLTSWDCPDKEVEP